MQAISREALPLPSTPKGVTTLWATKWAFIYVMRAEPKNSGIAYLRVPRVRNYIWVGLTKSSKAPRVKPRVGMTSASNFIHVTYLLHGTPNDLRHLLSYPITIVPLSLAHIDGTPLKTDKATLTKALQRIQHVGFVDTNFPSIKDTISDGGILLYESVMQNSKSTYAAMAMDLLVKVCSHRDESTTRQIQVSIHQGC